MPIPPSVGSTTKKIEDLINNDGFLRHDRNANLHEIATTLEHLHGSQLDQVLAKLGAKNLKNLDGQMDQGGLGRIIPGRVGLSPGERQDLFNDLAGDSSDTNGAEMATLFGDLSRGDQQMLAQAIAQHGTPKTKLDFIAGIRSQTTQQDDKVSSGIGQVSDTFGSPAANAVATVLGSMRGSSLDKALQGLSDPQLRAVVQAAEHETLTTTSEGPDQASTTTSFDTKQLANIINATASIDDVKQKARVFQFGAQALDDISGSNSAFDPDPTAKPQLQQVAGSLTHLLGSNTTGIIDQLNTDDATGQALISYTGELLNEGPSGQAQLGRFIAQLRQGNNFQTDPTTYINAHETSKNGDFYRHAENLGYFTGAVEEALLQKSQSTNNQADVIRNIFNAASSAGRTFGPAPVKVAIPILNGLTQQGINSVVNGINGSNAKERAAFFELALGQSPNGQRYRGPAEPAFITGIVATAGPDAEAPG